MRKLLFIILVLILFVPARVASAETNEYVINDFKSEIIIEENTDIMVTETITADFQVSKHGIFRTIPIVYSTNGKTIKPKFDLIGITDENGKSYDYTRSFSGRELTLKIGDPEVTLRGVHTYVISYKFSKILQSFDTHVELYWNAFGSNWDTDILNPVAVVVSPHANIENVVCFSGYVGSTTQNCEVEKLDNQVSFLSSQSLGNGSDMTMVVALSSDNKLIFPSKFQQTLSLLIDNWGYIVAVLPFVLMLFYWFKKGRDKRYAEGGEYYNPKNQNTKLAPIFRREHLPTVYAPIQGLTPAQVGTIIDGKVDTKDVIAEIIELARLRYIEIFKLLDKKLFKDAEYAFIDLVKDAGVLKDYQKVVYNELFAESLITKSKEKTDKLFKKNGDLQKAKKRLQNKNYSLLSCLKDNFYKSLPDFKKKLYQGLNDEGIFDGVPDKIRQKWIGFFIGFDLLAVAVLSYFVSTTYNPVPYVILFFLFIPGIIISYFMPRKTPLGYSLFRQIKGLHFYLGKGKWRHEVYEKNLFLEETLPLAVSLGVVDKLARDMEGLNIKPPSYMTGFTASTFGSDFGSFRSSAASTIVSSPKSSGSSWSGGSGFSGGSSGGGFGGGGGGSW